MAQSSALFVLFAALVCASSAIKFEVLPYQPRCIREEYRPDTLVSGTIEATENAHPDMQLSVRITDAEGNAVYENRDVTVATFAFTSQTEAEYAFCFNEQPRPGASANTYQRRLVNVSIRTGETRDYAALAKKENLQPIELELRKMEDQVNTLKSEFTYMKNREAMHRNTNESTNSRVAWMTFLSVGILLGLGVAQVYYLQKYFKSKKLI